ncbi:hypothetical protein FKM82_028353 [Ascaphus truei]
MLSHTPHTMPPMSLPLSRYLTHSTSRGTTSTPDISCTSHISLRNRTATPRTTVKQHATNVTPATSHTV